MTEENLEKINEKEEEWKPIPGYEHYKVSDRGNVINLVTGKLLTPQRTGGGYLAVNLYRDGRRPTRHRVHRLVYYAFNLEDNPKERGFVIDHIDRVRDNNILDNLRRITYKENNLNRNIWSRKRMIFYKSLEELTEEGEGWSDPIKLGSCRRCEYFASTHGKAVCHVRSGYSLIFVSTSCGRPRICVNGKQMLLYHFIWKAFNGWEEINGGSQIDHIDSNPENNRLDNLRLVESAEENSSNPNTRFKRMIPLVCLKFRGGRVSGWYPGGREASLAMGFSKDTVASAMSCECRCGGFYWMKEEDYLRDHPEDKEFIDHLRDKFLCKPENAHWKEANDLVNKSH